MAERVTQLLAKSNTHLELGERLRAYRERKGLTLEKMAGVLAAHGVDVSPSMLSLIERGVSRGSFGMRRRLLDFLGEGGH